MKSGKDDEGAGDPSLTINQSKSESPAQVKTRPWLERGACRPTLTMMMTWHVYLAKPDYNLIHSLAEVLAP